MGSVGRRRLLAALLTIPFGGGLLPGGFAAAPTTRPLVLVFMGGATAAGSGIEVKKDSADVTGDERTRRAAFAVVRLLNDSNAVMAQLYRADSPMFLRALQEARIQPVNRDEPTAAERVAIGKAAEAIYIVAIGAETPKSGSGIELVLNGTDLETGKAYVDRANASSELLSTNGNGSGDANAVRGTGNTGFTDNAVMSAANTLVLRLLAGPLGEFARAAPPKALLPPPPTAPAEEAPLVTPAQKPASNGKDEPLRGTHSQITIAPPAKTVAPNPTTSLDIQEPSSEETALAARQQAESLLTTGDTNAAINLLRKTINQAPLNLPLRVALTRAYLAAKRAQEAASEAQRALTLAAGNDRNAQTELTRMLAQALALNGDTTAARGAYEQIIASQPQAYWAQVALANLLLEQNRREDAETLFRSVRRADPGNRDAALGLARLLADKGDYAGAQQELLSSSGTDSQATYDSLVAFFDERALRLGSLLSDNRAAWQQGTLSREALFKATSAQNGRITSLLAILKAATPPPGSPEAVTRAYKGRVYAGSLLSQAISAFLNFLETGDADANSNATLQITEFQKTMEQVRQLDGKH